jgi:hypothetical protein
MPSAATLLAALVAGLGQAPGLPASPPAPAGPNVVNYAPPIDFFEGPFGPVAASPPLIVVAPGGGFFGPVPGPTVVPAVPMPMLVSPAGFGPSYPTPPPPPAPRRAPGPKAVGRAAELIRLGDRHFRAGDLPRAVKRYEQAIAAHPELGLPRSRLAQVELARGKFREAVDRLREATAAEPGWVAFADDVQGLYPEPAAYRAMIARLEGHLHEHPFDRDAWTLLGTQWLLSGRRQLAADAFLRLTDRPPDALLERLLAASGAR